MVAVEVVWRNNGELYLTFGLGLKGKLKDSIAGSQYLGALLQKSLSLYKVLAYVGLEKKVLANEFPAAAAVHVLHVSSTPRYKAHGTLYSITLTSRYSLTLEGICSQTCRPWTPTPPSSPPP
jgi:hypothetical protein